MWGGGEGRESLPCCWWSHGELCANAPGNGEHNGHNVPGGGHPVRPSALCPHSGRHTGPTKEGEHGPLKWGTTSSLLKWPHRHVGATNVHAAAGLRPHNPDPGRRGGVVRVWWWWAGGGRGEREEQRWCVCMCMRVRVHARVRVHVRVPACQGGPVRLHGRCVVEMCMALMEPMCGLAKVRQRTRASPIYLASLGTMRVCMRRYSLHAWPRTLLHTYHLQHPPYEDSYRPYRGALQARVVVRRHGCSRRTCMHARTPFAVFLGPASYPRVQLRMCSYRLVMSVACSLVRILLLWRTTWWWVLYYTRAVRFIIYRCLVGRHESAST